MNNSHELIDKFKDRKDVVFLYVNVKDENERWKTFLEKEKLGGVNLYADQEQSQFLSKEYNLEGIPRFILIDRRGNIINSVAEFPAYAEKSILEAVK
jgi:thioredoxin-related protein